MQYIPAQTQVKRCQTRGLVSYFGLARGHGGILPRKTFNILADWALVPGLVAKNATLITICSAA